VGQGLDALDLEMEQGRGFGGAEKFHK
jgi:hypothetical protein